MNFGHETSNAKKLRLSLDFRVIAAVLLLVIAVMLLIWKPWSSAPGANGRTIEVRGDSTMSATPDEFVFYPTYEFKNADKAAALAELSKKSDEIVTKLKELGVTEKQIKTASSAYGDYSYYNSGGMPEPTPANNTYSLSLTVTLNDQALVQRVQDYLVATNPTGAVSPQANFSEAKRKALERTARDLAVNDAKNKANQVAQKLGFKVDKVKTISDGAGFSILPTEARGATTMATDQKASLGVHPGENELPYSVTVVYFIK